MNGGEIVISAEWLVGFMFFAGFLLLFNSARNEEKQSTRQGGFVFVAVVLLIVWLAAGHPGVPNQW